MMNWRSASQIDDGFIDKLIVARFHIGKKKRYVATKVRMDGERLFVRCKGEDIYLDDLAGSGIDDMLYIRLDEIL